MKRALCVSTALALVINATWGFWPRPAQAEDDSQLRLYFTIPFGGPEKESEPRFGLRFDQQLPDNIALPGGEGQMHPMMDLQFNQDGLTRLNFGGLSLPVPSDGLYQNGGLLPPGSQLFDWLPDFCLEDQLSYWLCLVGLAGVAAGAGYGIYEATSDDGNNNHNHNPSPPASPPPASPPPPESPPPPPPPPIEEGGLDMPGDELNAYV
jgi:hypothetical protein